MVKDLPLYQEHGHAKSNSIFMCAGWYKIVGTQSSETTCGVRIDRESCRKSSPKVNILEYEREGGAVLCFHSHCIYLVLSIGGCYPGSKIPRVMKEERGM